MAITGNGAAERERAARDRQVVRGHPPAVVVAQLCAKCRSGEVPAVAKSGDFGAVPWPQVSADPVKCWDQRLTERSRSEEVGVVFTLGDAVILKGELRSKRGAGVARNGSGALTG